MKALLCAVLALALCAGAAQAATGHGKNVHNSGTAQATTGKGGNDQPSSAATAKHANAHKPAVPPAKAALHEAQVTGRNGNWVTLKVETGNGVEKVRADASHAMPVVATLEPGDQIRAKLVLGDKPEIRDAVLESRWADYPRRWAALIGSLALLVAFAAIVTGGRLRCYLIGVDKRYSKSQVQIVIWATLSGTAYLATLFLRVWAGGPVGGIGLTNNLFLLSGLSAISFGAAKAITVNKNHTVAGPRKTQGSPDLRDLVRDDLGRPDFGDLQMIAITLLAAAIYFWQVFVWLGPVQLAPKLDLPDVDTFLLASFGLGQGAYLAKKAVLPVGS